MSPSRPPSLPRIALRILCGSLLMALILYGALAIWFRFDGYGEGLYDLHYIAGGWLREGWPTPELWRPGGQVESYYNFGLAGWGWLGGGLGLSLGQTYVLGLILLPSLVFGIYFALMGGAWPTRAMAALVATFPATGLSLGVGAGWVQLPEHLRNMAHVRLTEWADRIGASRWAEQVVTGRAYPVESLAHVNLDLQDLHPPVFSFFLLATLLLWFFSQPRQPVSGWPAALRQGFWPGFLLPLCFAVNAWAVPVMLGSVLGLLLLRGSWRLWAGALLGALVSFVALWWPFFRNFDSPAAVKVVWLAPEHWSEPLSWLLIWWPCLLAMLWLYLGLGRETRRRRLDGFWWAPLLFLAAVLSLELVHLDDLYGGTHERFNSVLKTGSFALSAWVASLLILATRTRRKLAWVPVLLILLLPSAMQLKDIGAKLWRDADGQPNWALGDAGMIKEPDLQANFMALRHRPPGTTLEFTEATAYTVIPLSSTLLAWPTWSGWASHLDQVNSFGAGAWATRNALQDWYRSFPPAAGVLEQAGVDYILVGYRLHWGDAAIAERSDHLGPQWLWRPTGRTPAGYWSGFFERVEG